MSILRPITIIRIVYLVCFTVGASNGISSLYTDLNILEPRRGGGHGGGGGGSSDSGSGGTSSGSGSSSSSSTSSGSSSSSSTCNDPSPKSYITDSSNTCLIELGDDGALCFGRCIIKSIGEICCKSEGKCKAGQYCAYTKGFCCEMSSSPEQCASGLGISAPPSSFQPGDADAPRDAKVYPNSTSPQACLSSGSLSVSSGESGGAMSGVRNNHIFFGRLSVYASFSAVVTLGLMLL